MVPADDESVALDELGELTKVLHVLSEAVTNVDLATDLEKLLAQWVLQRLAQAPAGVRLASLLDSAAVFFGLNDYLGLGSKERGMLLKVLNRLRKAGLIEKASRNPYRITVDAWLKIQEAKRATSSNEAETA